MKDTKKKSLIKTITWRIIAILIAIVVAFVFLGEIVISLEISLTANGLSTIFYYYHERMWNKYA